MAFDTVSFCDFTSAAAKAMAGQNVLLAVYNDDGSKLLAVAGQQELTINRSAESIETSSKDTQGGWKSKIAGMKEWSIDTGGLYVLNDESHTALTNAFESGDPICVKIVDIKNQKGMFGGLAAVTEYTLEAPYDDSMTYSITLEGMGALVDLTANPVTPDTMPEGTVTNSNSGGGDTPGV